MKNPFVQALVVLVVGGFLAWGLAQFSGGFALLLGGGVILTGLVLLFPSRKSGGLPSRLATFALVIVGIIATNFGGEQRDLWIESELTAAREVGPDAYLETVRELRGENAWLEALEQEDPDQYQAIVAQEEEERRARRIEIAQEREPERVCENVKQWLMQEGTRQYQRNAASGVSVLSVSSGRCIATLQEDGLFEVHVEGVEVALRGRDNPYNLQADAIVRPDNPNTDNNERAVCRIAWGPFDWVETTAQC